MQRNANKQEYTYIFYILNLPIEVLKNIIQKVDHIIVIDIPFGNMVEYLSSNH